MKTHRRNASRSALVATVVTTVFAAFGAAPAGAAIGLTATGAPVTGFACVPISTATLAAGVDSEQAVFGNTKTSIINWGDSLGVETGNVILTSPASYSVQGSHIYDLPGSYPLTIIVNRATSRADATATGTATIADTPVTAVPESPLPTTNLSGVEGSTVSGDLGSFIGSACTTAGDYTAIINWGDGNITGGSIQGFHYLTTLPNQPAAFDVHGSHVYDEFGVYRISVAVVRSGFPTTGAATQATATIADAPLHINGAAPFASGSSAPDLGHTVLLGSTTLLGGITAEAELNSTGGAGPSSGVLATFTDDDPNGRRSDYGALISWGDGTVTPGFIGGPFFGPWTVFASHQYLTAGAHMVTVSVYELANPSTVVVDTTTITVSGNSLCLDTNGTFTTHTCP